MKNITSINRRFFINSALVGATLLATGCTRSQTDTTTSSTSANPTARVSVDPNEKVVLQEFPILSTNDVELGSKETDTSSAEFQAETYNGQYHRRDLGGSVFFLPDMSAKSFFSTSTLGAQYDSDQEAFARSYFFKPTVEYHRALKGDEMTRASGLENVAWASTYSLDGSLGDSAKIFLQPLGSLVLRKLEYDARDNTAYVATYVIEDRFITDSFDQAMSEYEMMNSATMNGLKLRTPPTLRVLSSAGRLYTDGTSEQYIVTTLRYINGTLPL